MKRHYLRAIFQEFRGLGAMIDHLKKYIVQGFDEVKGWVDPGLWEALAAFDMIQRASQVPQGAWPKLASTMVDCCWGCSP